MTVKIGIYSRFVHCDRYHLLHSAESIDNSPIYEEYGLSFNGFEQPVIINTSIENVYDCRMAYIQITEFNNGNPVYCMINTMKPLTKNKTAVYLEPDAWMNYRSDNIVGLDNYLFETTRSMNYPYFDLESKNKIITREQVIEESDYYKVIILYHNSTTANDDSVFYIRAKKIDFGFPFYRDTVFIAMSSIGIDTNSIVGIYLSPFELDISQMVQVYRFPTDDSYFWIYKCPYARLIDYYKSNPIVKPVFITHNYTQKSLITDMTGNCVWSSVKEDNGVRYLFYRLDLRYDGCDWLFSVGVNQNDTLCYTVNKRFVMSCVELGYFVDYYQSYQNTMKQYNNDLRKAQLDKQLTESIGGIVSSTTSGAIGGAIAGATPVGAIAGAVGGVASTVASYYATSDYNRKLEVIEDRQAMVQYDTCLANTNTFYPFFIGETEPCINTVTIDSASINADYYDVNIPYLRYNCRIRRSDLISLLNASPLYVSGDFDFVNINTDMAKQLNERFKHGVYFVRWSGNYD